MTSTAVHGATTAQVFMDRPYVDSYSGMTISADYEMRYESASLPGLNYNSAITVDGVAYHVREVRAILDGAESIAKLSKD